MQHNASCISMWTWKKAEQNKTKMILRETPASCVRRIALRWSVSLPYVPFALLLSGIVVVFTVFFAEEAFHLLRFEDSNAKWLNYWWHDACPPSKNWPFSNKIRINVWCVFVYVVAIAIAGQSSSLSYLHSVCMANRWSCTSGTEATCANYTA